MPDKILHKRSYTPGSKPTTSNLEASGELAINVNDGKAYLRKSGSGIDTIEEFIITNAVNTGSLTISGSVTVTGSLNATSVTSSFTGSLTGSLFGTASWAFNASQSISASSAVSSSYAFSASYAQNASNALTASSADEFTIRTDAFEFTGSINVSGSITLTGSLDAPTITGSLLGTSSWAVSASNAVTAAFATNVPDTASWAISASQALTSSQALTASYALSGLSGTAATASFVTASDVWGPFGSNSILSASYASGSTSASYTLLAESASYASGSTSSSFALFATSASYASGSTSASFASFAISASYASGSTSASYASGSTSASFAVTASSADNFLIRNSATITGSINQTGSFTTTGTLTAQTLIVQTITASIEFLTGSTKFGDATDDTHQFTGSVGISGSLTVVGPTIASGSFTGSLIGISSGSFTGSYTGSYTGSLTGALIGTASWASNSVTASTADSFTVRNGITLTGSLNQSGSSTIRGDQLISGSLRVTGSTSLTGSLNILGAISASSFTGSFTGSYTGSYTGSFTGSLIGTSSWAQSASFALFATSASYASGSTSASFSLFAISASYASGSTSASYASGSTSASYASGSTSASYALSASVITSTNTNAFVQGGNSFAVAAVLGTNDNYSLAIETSGSTRLFITGSEVINPIQYLGATSASNATSITLPSTLAGGGLIENDLVIVTSIHGNASASVPTGYTSSTNAFTSSMGYMWAYKFMGSTPDTTVTNITGSTIAFAFRNVNRSTPFNISSSVSSSTTSSGMPDSPAISTTVNGAMVVALGFLDRDGGFVITAPAAYTLIGYTGSISAPNSGSIMGAYFQQTTAGTANPAAFGGAGNDLWAASTLALNPITSSGNIGINNTTPLTTLHIGTPISDDFNLTNQAPVRISLPAFNRSASITEALFIDHIHSDFTSGSGTAIVMGYKSPTYGGYTSRIINYNSLTTTTGTRLQLQTQTGLSNNTWNTGLLINENGRIGINTTTPDSASLTVNGNIWAISITGSYTGSFNGIYTGSYTGSFTGSFIGTSSWATSASSAITAAFASNATLFDGLDSTVFATTGSNTFRGDQLISGSLRITGSASLTGSFNILGAVSASSFTGSFTGSLTGSLIGTASWATNAVTASSADSFTVRNGITITGSLNQSGNLNILGAISASSFTGSYTGSFTGSFTGTASWAQSASNALTASFVSSTGTNAFVQGGNSFGSQAILGTNDVYPLAIETNGITRLFVTSSEVISPIQYLGATSASNATSMTLPSTLAGGGLIENDLVIVASMHGNASASHPIGYITGANAFTSSMGYMWAYKFMGSTPDTTITNITGSTIAFAFRNVNRSIPFNISSSASSSAATGMPDSPAIFTTVNGSMVVALGFLDRDAGFVVTAPSLYTLIGYTGSVLATNSGSVMAAYFQQSVSGTANPAVFGGTGNDLWVASTLALNPITGSGNIGINNTNPLTTLHIGSHIDQSGDFNLTNKAPLRITLPIFDTSSSINEALFIDHRHGDFASGAGTAIVMGYKNPSFGSYTSRIINYTNTNTTTGTRLQLQTQREGSNNTWNTGVLINENGNVSIGTVSPSTRLHISGANGEILRLEAAGIGNNYIGFSSGSTSLGYIGYGSAANNSLALVNYRNDLVVIGTNSAGVITISGSSVGIGTTTPTSASLTVNGNIWATSITGSLTGSLIGTASWSTSASNAVSAAYASNADLFDGLNSTIFATTGSNTFRGTETISGSLVVTGSTSLTGSLGLLGAISASSFTGSYTGSLTGALIGTSSWAQSASNAVAAINATSATNASTSTTQASSNNSTNIATTAYVKSLLGAADTAGTLDWNDVSNTRPGSSPTLLLGTATNGFSIGNYYHPFNLEYASKDGTGQVTQLAISYGTPGNDIRMRGRYLGTWSSWVTFLNSSNYNSYSPTLTGTGASGTWGINITGTAASETLSTVTGRGSSTSTTVTLNGGMSLGGNMQVTTATSPYTQYLQFGDNSGWTFRFMTNISGTPTTRFSFTDTGTFTAVGDVVAFSDAKFKTNVKTIENALEKVISLRGVTYNRTDIENENEKIGVIAQEVQQIFPQVVTEDKNGTLGVSYGNITAILIEAIKEQQKQIEDLQKQINYLTENK